MTSGARKVQTCANNLIMSKCLNSIVQELANTESIKKILKITWQQKGEKSHDEQDAF